VFQSKHYEYTGYSTASIPDGGAGSAKKSGWMTGDDFALLMEYFIKHVELAKDRSMLSSPESHYHEIK